MEYNDYELVCLAQEGNTKAIDIIYNKYMPIIVKKSKNAIFTIKQHGIEINDIMQEGYLGLDEAIKNFSQDDVATFYTFANLCIDRKISNYLRNIVSNKNRLLNEAIFIDDNIENLISDKSNIEDELVNRNMQEDIINKVKKKLTFFENSVFELIVSGYNFTEIANNLNRDVKSIYNTVDRIKHKVKKVMEEDN
ncbi:MAG: sigma-70 family RNA polymerase sigma factor [Bacilli bacterium]|nr:sigma-70 family RNA polymerase sigma factor [Bacilli bacterium]